MQQMQAELANHTRKGWEGARNKQMDPSRPSWAERGAEEVDRRAWDQQLSDICQPGCSKKRGETTTLGWRRTRRHGKPQEGERPDGELWGKVHAGRWRLKPKEEGIAVSERIKRKAPGLGENHGRQRGAPCEGRVR